MEIFAMLWKILENIIILLNCCKFWKILDKYEIYFPKKKTNCDPGRGTGECQTLSVTFTLRTSLKDVRGHSNWTSGDIPTGCPAMFYFCIFT